jgi:hypothetical protein
LRPSEYSVLLLDRSRHRPKSSSSGISRSFRVRHPLEYRPYWFCDPALPLARCLGCAVFLARAAADDSYVIGRVLSSNLTFPLECYPATPTRPPQRPSPLMGFASLQHLRNSRSTSPRASRPATFRLQGLVTLLAACSLESRAGFVSHRRRSWDLPFEGFLSREVSPAFRLGRTHVPLAQRFFPPPKRQTGPTGLGFWVHASRDCLATARRFRPRVTGASLGFCPSRVRCRRPCPGLLRRSSRVLGRNSRLLAVPARTSECLSAFASPRPTVTGVPAGRGNPHGVSAPVRSWTFELTSARAIEFTARRVVHYCRLADGFWALAKLCRGCSGSDRCRNPIRVASAGGHSGDRRARRGEDR